MDASTDCESSIGNSIYKMAIEEVVVGNRQASHEVGSLTDS